MRRTHGYTRRNRQLGMMFEAARADEYQQIVEAIRGDKVVQNLPTNFF